MDEIKLKEALRIAEENNNTISFNILKLNMKICTREANEILKEIEKLGIAKVT